MTNKICFVIMGFGKKPDYYSGGTILDMDKTYSSIIKPIVTKCKYKCIRADELMDSGSIDRVMYAMILHSDLVIADISTLNPNAIYELGVRHGVKNRATIIMKANSNIKIPFDLDHTRILEYNYIGTDISKKEIDSVKQTLDNMIINIDQTENIDSPLYTNLNVKEPEFAEDEYLKIIGEFKKNKFNLYNLSQQAQNFMHEEKYTEAIPLWEAAANKSPSEPFYTQQLALATYKSKSPSPLVALTKAIAILSKLDSSSDTETLGLLGAVYKRLYLLKKDEIELLDKAIEYYRRGFVIDSDYYTGENYAACLEMKTQIQDMEEDEKTYSRVEARKTRESIYEILSKERLKRQAEGYELDTWQLATMASCCLVLKKVDEYTQYERLFREKSSPDKQSSYLEQREITKSIFNIK